MVDYVLTGLVKRRAELAGEIEATHDQLRKLIADMEHLDATILQFSPDYQVAEIRPRAFRPPKDWARRGEMTRLVLDILRQAAEPMSSRDVAYELMGRRALDRDDGKLLRLMSKRTGVALRGARDRGHVQSEQGSGQYQLWRVARRP